MRIFLASGHVREEPLELHALGDLPASSAFVVERHVKDCQHCKRESLEIAQLIHRLRVLAVQTRLTVSLSIPTRPGSAVH